MKESTTTYKKASATVNTSSMAFADDEVDDKLANCKIRSSLKLNVTRKNMLDEHMDEEHQVEKYGEDDQEEEVWPFLIDVEGSISNIDEIESDKRRQSLKIVRNELKRSLRGLYKKQARAVQT